MSAILSALQLQSLRSAILHDTGGHLYQNSRLSRLAERLGSAIRAQHPDAVDRDCLRNAVNSFTYQDPITLPQMAPTTQLSSEPHSFSRVFTGAFFEALAGMLAAFTVTLSIAGWEPAMMRAVGAALILFLTGMTAPTRGETAQPDISGTVVLLVRHAEKAAQPGDDPPLTQDGRRRAEALARLSRMRTQPRS
jgi:hypothetical protein